MTLLPKASHHYHPAGKTRETTIVAGAETDGVHVTGEKIKVL